MHLAFSDADLADLGLPGLIRLASEHAVGLEIRSDADLVGDPQSVARRLADGGVALAAVWTTVPVGRDQAVAAAMARVVNAAAAAGCRLVRLVEPRSTTPAALRRAAGVAAAVGVHLAVDNPPLRDGIVDCWRRLDAVDHPSVGCRLDTLNAALGGDGPSVAVPTLASRLALVGLRHPPSDAETVHRLAGVGYDGYLCVDPAAIAAVRTWLPK